MSTPFKLKSKSSCKVSPLKQKLSPKARKAKAERDLAYANTPDRKAKRAHSQKKHRDNPNAKGDYDHKSGAFKSVKANRGNDGAGTKKEGGKKYATPGYKKRKK